MRITTRERRRGPADDGDPEAVRTRPGRRALPISVSFPGTEHVDAFVEDVSERAGRALGEWSGAALPPAQIDDVRAAVADFLEERLGGSPEAGRPCELRFEDWEECEGMEVHLAGRIVCALGPRRGLAPALDLMSVWIPSAIHPAILLRLAVQPDAVLR